MSEKIDFEINFDTKKANERLKELENKITLLRAKKGGYSTTPFSEEDTKKLNELLKKYTELDEKIKAFKNAKKVDVVFSSKNFDVVDNQIKKLISYSTQFPKQFDIKMKNENFVKSYNQVEKLKKNIEDLSNKSFLINAKLNLINSQSLSFLNNLDKNHIIKVKLEVDKTALKDIKINIPRQIIAQKDNSVIQKDNITSNKIASDIINRNKTDIDRLKDDIAKAHTLYSQGLLDYKTYQREMDTIGKKIQIVANPQIENDKKLAESIRNSNKTFLELQEERVNKARELNQKGLLDQQSYNRELQRIIKEGEKYSSKLPQQKTINAPKIDIVDTNKELEKANRLMDNFLLRAIRSYVTFQLIQGTINAIASQPIQVLEISKVLENGVLGISALTSANTKLMDGTKEITDVYQKFAHAGMLTEKTILDIKKASVETAATFPQLTEVFQIAIGPAMGAGQAMGKTVEEITKNTIDFAKKMSNIAVSIGMPIDQLNEEMRSILNADVTKNSRIATMLQMTPKDIDKAKEQINGLSDYLQKKLLAFEPLETAQSFDVLYARFKDTMDTIRLEGGSNVFELLKMDIVELTSFFTDNQENMVSILDKTLTNIFYRFDDLFRSVAIGFNGISESSNNSANDIYNAYDILMRGLSFTAGTITNTIVSTIKIAIDGISGLIDGAMYGINSLALSIAKLDPFASETTLQNLQKDKDSSFKGMVNSGKNIVNTAQNYLTNQAELGKNFNNPITPQRLEYTQSKKQFDSKRDKDLSEYQTQLNKLNKMFEKTTDETTKKTIANEMSKISNTMSVLDKNIKAFPNKAKKKEKKEKKAQSEDALERLIIDLKADMGKVKSTLNYDNEFEIKTGEIEEKYQKNLIVFRKFKNKNIEVLEEWKQSQYDLANFQKMLAQNKQAETYNEILMANNLIPFNGDNVSNMVKVKLANLTDSVKKEFSYLTEEQQKIVIDTKVKDFEFGINQKQLDNQIEVYSLLNDEGKKFLTEQEKLKAELQKKGIFTNEQIEIKIKSNIEEQLQYFYEFTNNFDALSQKAKKDLDIKFNTILDIQKDNLGLKNIDFKRIDELLNKQVAEPLSKNEFNELNSLLEKEKDISKYNAIQEKTKKQYNLELFNQQLTILSKQTALVSLFDTLIGTMEDTIYNLLKGKGFNGSQILGNIGNELLKGVSKDITSSMVTGLKQSGIGSSLLGGFSSFSSGLKDLFKGTQASNTSTLYTAGRGVGGALIGGVGGYYGGKTLDKLFNTTGTKSSQFGGIGGGIAGGLYGLGMINPLMAGGILAGSLLLGGMFGKTKITGSGLNLTQGLTKDNIYQNLDTYTDYKKKSLFSSKSWTTYGEIDYNTFKAIEDKLTTYQDLLINLNAITQKMVIESSGKISADTLTNILLPKEFLLNLMNIPQTIKELKSDIAISFGDFTGNVFDGGFEVITKEIEKENPQLTEVYNSWTNYANYTKKTIEESIAEVFANILNTKDINKISLLNYQGLNGSAIVESSNFQKSFNKAQENLISQMINNNISDYNYFKNTKALNMLSGGYEIDLSKIDLAKLNFEELTNTILKSSPTPEMINSLSDFGIAISKITEIASQGLNQIQSYYVSIGKITQEKVNKDILTKTAKELSYTSPLDDTFLKTYENMTIQEQSKYKPLLDTLITVLQDGFNRQKELLSYSKIRDNGLVNLNNKIIKTSYSLNENSKLAPQDYMMEWGDKNYLYNDLNNKIRTNINGSIKLFLDADNQLSRLTDETKKEQAKKYFEDLGNEISSFIDDLSNSVISLKDISKSITSDINQGKFDIYLSQYANNQITKDKLETLNKDTNLGGLSVENYISKQKSLIDINNPTQAIEIYNKTYTDINAYYDKQISILEASYDIQKKTADYSSSIKNSIESIEKYNKDLLIDVNLSPYTQQKKSQIAFSYLQDSQNKLIDLYKNPPTEATAQQWNEDISKYTSELTQYSSAFLENRKATSVNYGFDFDLIQSRLNKVTQQSNLITGGKSVEELTAEQTNAINLLKEQQIKDLSTLKITVDSTSLTMVNKLEDINKTLKSLQLTSTIDLSGLKANLSLAPTITGGATLQKTAEDYTKEYTTKKTDLTTQYNNAVSQFQANKSTEWANTIKSITSQVVNLAGTYSKMGVSIDTNAMTQWQTGVLEWLSGKGFSNGGFTGIGSNNEIAGVTHKNEYVAPANQVQKYLPLFKKLDRERKGYKDGGFVGMEVKDTKINEISLNTLIEKLSKMLDLDREKTIILKQINNKLQMWDDIDAIRTRIA